MKINVKLRCKRYVKNLKVEPRTIYCATISKPKYTKEEIESAMAQFRKNMEESNRLEKKIQHDSLEFAKTFRPF